MLETILSSITVGGSIWAGLAAIALTLAIAYLLPKLPEATKLGMTWLRTQVKKVDNEYAQGVLDRLTIMAGTLVLKYENTAIERLKEEVADGKITLDELPAALKAIKDSVLEDLQEQAELQAIWEKAKIVFMGDEEALNEWLEHQVEAAVAELPPSGLQTPKPEDRMSSDPYSSIPLTAVEKAKAAQDE